MYHNNKGPEILVDLIVLRIQDFKVIPRMDGLSAHHAKLHCSKKVVAFPTSKG